MGSFTIRSNTGDLTVVFPDHVPNEARAAELETAWTRVKPAGHWKGPIDATVDIAAASELTDVKDAVVFFTATEATAIPMGRAPDGRKRFRITAPGYWAGPAN